MKARAWMLNSVVAPIVAAGFIVASAGLGHATTYVQTSDDCTGGCGTSSSNTVTVTTAGTNTLDILFSLANGFNFIHSGFPGSFGFGRCSGFTAIDFVHVAHPRYHAGCT